MANGAAVPGESADHALIDAGVVGYRMLLPALPKGKRLETTVFLHGDPRGRPYRTQDFAEALEATVGMGHVVGLGVFQFNHVFVCMLDTTDMKDTLAAMKELKVKGKRCVVVDPNVVEAEIRVYWLPAYVTDEEVRAALKEFRNVTQVTREKRKSSDGGYEIETTTRGVRIILKEGLRKEELPHQGAIAGYPVLVSVPGRPPMCLRCNQLGHMRRQCRAPWCRRCRGYSHIEAECVPTYAAKTRHQPESVQRNGLLDDGDTLENKASRVTAAQPTPQALTTSNNMDTADTKAPNNGATEDTEIGRLPEVEEQTTVPPGEANAAPSEPALTPTAEPALPTPLPAPTAAPVKGPLPEPDAGVPLKDTKATRQSVRNRKNRELAPTLPVMRPVEAGRSSPSAL
ncbi:uncharacterized protein LOC115330970 [Ixodes scapularis]|uniref:uncharacterized protein LOC115330970 n=1 Tax=Ixodes scapularis TaxID=6945 RepID=UPI001A9F32CC|nr:uncharacterized protein LOC115330970 [Ixodes scapularis]